MAEQIYKISEKYTDSPGGRNITEGPFSGEDFRKKVLEPFFQTKKDGDKLIIDLDDLNGYPSSFFEEAFGGIARIYKPEEVIKSLKFSCTDDPLVVDDMISYINQEYAEK